MADKDWEKQYIEKLRADALRRIRGEAEVSEVGAGVWEGSAAEAQFNDLWDNISLEGAISQVPDTVYGRGHSISDDDPAMAAFRARFGEASFDPAEMNDKPLTGLRFSYEKPTLYGRDIGEWAQDPSRVMQLEDGRWVWEAGNVKGDVLANLQAQDADSGFFKGDAMDFLKIAAFFAGGMGLESLLAGTTEAVAGAGITQTATGTVATDGLGGAFLTTAPEATLEAAVGSSAAAPTATTVAAGAGNAGGLVNAAAAAAGGGGIISQGMAWLNGLSPVARQALGMAVSTGANALLQRNAQQNMLDAQRAAEDRAREDKQRRGQVQAFQPGSFNPKPLPGGLINRGGI